MARKFTERLLEVSMGNGGRVVKTMGDRAMLLFDSASEAVAAALDLLVEFPRVGLPPLRVGRRLWPNPAISNAAPSTWPPASPTTRGPNEVLVSSSVLPESADGIALEEIGAVTLKGVAQPVQLLRARRQG